MKQFSNLKNRRFTQNLAIFLVGATIAVWLLRGIGILTFIPGGVILLLILLSISMGILMRLQTTWWR